MPGRRRGGMDGVQHALSASEASGFRAVYQFVVLCVVSARSKEEGVKRIKRTSRASWA